MRYSDFREENERNRINVSTKTIVAAVIAVFLLITLCASIKIIPTGYTGVRSTFGQISEDTCPNGFNWKIPYVQSIEKVNNKQQDMFIEEKIWSETKARTAIYYENTTITYRINPEKSAWIFANVSDYKDNLVKVELVQSGLKAASKEFEDNDATNRALIEPKAKEEIQRVLDEKYGKNVVFVSKVAISNADFDKEYNQAIAAKQKAVIEAEKQAIENTKKVEKAKADAEAKKIAAQGEADAKKLLEKSITDKTLQEKYLDKWNGQLPQYVGGDDSNIMFGFNK